MSEHPGRADAVGLTADEYDLIVGMIGREPTDLELGMYGLMWSEHCSYKSSRVHLGRFPTEAPHVVMGPGENAGVVDIGDGLVAVFRIESHNHPSAIEPFQGAATGVGGILRDIFTMGARPVALLDSLRFGDPSHPRNRFLVGGVVSGIASYGNSVGVPTVGGELSFDDDYADNPLVNVMCLGISRGDALVLGRAAGTGNPVLLVGATTGRDGIHGASLLASQEFDGSPEDMRPAVQVGDPFMEKLLIEACLELVERGLAIGLNDLGAAGLTSACSETAYRAGSGMVIDVALVPRRETGMTPYEIMLSESQERMLVIAPRGREDQVREVFDRWGLESAIIGHVTDGDRLTVMDGGQVVADLPVESLSGRSPVYERPLEEPCEPPPSFDLGDLELPDDLGAVLASMVGSPNLGSKEWVWRQYDHMVGTDTVVLPGADAAVVRIKGTGKALSLGTDGNSRFCYLDPRRGGALAVAEAARNAICVGARPLAITNCLNFGNPERPHTMWRFREVIEGMAEACRALGTPVTGGNVSFYNETNGRAVKPTPIVGMLGLVEDVERHMTPGFREPGHVVALLGASRGHLGGSEYLKHVTGMTAGRAPSIDWDLERSVQEACLSAIRDGIAASAHDVADGGLAVALAECCFSAAPGASGASIAVCSDLRPDRLLFGEEPSRIIVSFPRERLAEMELVAAGAGAPLAVLGEVTAGPELVVSVSASGAEKDRQVVLDVDLDRLHTRWREALRWILA